MVEVDTGSRCSTSQTIIGFLAVVTGSLFRLNMGLKGVTGGAVVGGVLGFAGLFC